ncbi:hypothetical protein Pelo_11813 [Pelomyxa schiedti]|nr:hypothetical protein Pelo_11813 [Pelomyxa schiedti]
MKAQWMILMGCVGVLFLWFQVLSLFALRSHYTGQLEQGNSCRNTCAVCTGCRLCEKCVEGSIWPELGCVMESTPNALTEYFDGIYAKREWTTQGGGSGPGSILERAIFTMTALEDLMLHAGMRRLWDASCGSMFWMPTFLNLMQEKHGIAIEYFGSDAVRGLIEDHRRTFSNHSNWHFAFLDFTRNTLDILPPVDVVMMRDTLFHLPTAGVQSALINAGDSGARWLLATNNHQLQNNSELVWSEMGSFRQVNIMLPPYCVQKPFRVYADAYPERELLLLSLPIQQDQQCLQQSKSFR